MQSNNRLMVSVVVIAGLQLSPCPQVSGAEQAKRPAYVEHIEGTDLVRLTLTKEAIKRIGLKTVQVRQVNVSRKVPRPRVPIELSLSGNGKKSKVVPYSALIYDSNGKTFVYTSPKPRTFVRQKVDVDYIKGNLVVLNEGPPVGTVVASVGVAELYGTEFEIGH